MPFAKPYWVWQLLYSQVSCIWVQGTLPTTYYLQKFKHSQLFCFFEFSQHCAWVVCTIHNNYYSLHLTQCILLFRNEWNSYITCTCLSHCHGHRHKVQHSSLILLWCEACVYIEINLVLSSNLLMWAISRWSYQLLLYTDTRSHEFSALVGGFDFTFELSSLQANTGGMFTWNLVCSLFWYILHFFKTIKLAHPLAMYIIYL